MNLDDIYAEDPARTPRRPRHAAQVPDDVADSIRTRLAATKVRRMCNTHDCTGTPASPCQHPNHRRDADRLLSTDKEFPGMLDMLGLSTTWEPVGDDERRTWLTWIGQSGPADTEAA